MAAANVVMDVGFATLAILDPSVRRRLQEAIDVIRPPTNRLLVLLLVHLFVITYLFKGSVLTFLGIRIDSRPRNIAIVFVAGALCVAIYIGMCLGFLVASLR